MLWMSYYDTANKLAGHSGISMVGIPRRDSVDYSIHGVVCFALGNITKKIVTRLNRT
jgi:hypothetical protein